MIDMQHAVSRTFARAGVRARAVGDVVEALAVRSVHVDADPLDVVAAARMRRALCTALGSRRVILQDADDGGLSVMVPQPQRRALTIPQLWRIAPPAGLAVPVGLDVNMQPVVWDIAQVPHAYAGGLTGSGKSWLVRTIIAGLAVGNAPGSLRIVPIDPKGQTWIDPLCRLAHLDHAPATNAPDGNAALERVCDEIRARIAGMSPRIPMVVIADEANMLDPELLRYIVDYGRELAVHALYTSRVLSKESGMPREVWSQLPARFCGAVAAGDHYTSKMALGNARLATHLLGRGDMYACLDDVLTRFQAAGCHPEASFWRASGWAGRVAESELERVTAGEGSEASRQPRAVHWSQERREMTPDERAWILDQVDVSGRVPGIGRIAEQLGVGKPVATRWQGEVIELLGSDRPGHPGRPGASEVCVLAHDARVDTYR